MTEYIFTIRTPVHVGGGERLSLTDFVIETGKCIIVDIESVLTELHNNHAALDDFGGENFRIANFLNRYKLSPSNFQKYAIQVSRSLNPKEIYEMIKTGMGKPLLPGSSIKGAIRTVLLWHLVNTIPEKKLSQIYKGIINSDIKNEQADNQLDQFIFGSDPNHDFLRSLLVADGEFRISEVGLTEVKVMTLNKSLSSYSWKKMPRTSVDNHAEATSIFCESLQLGATSMVRIREIEKFLYDNPLAANELNFLDKRELLENLPEKCNQYAQDFIKEEMTFFESCGMEPMVNFYQDLQSEIIKMDGTFYLHLGWGSGWRGMTGAYLEEDDLIQFRRRFKLGRKDFPIFPKTRKIAFEQGQPRYPMGWIKIQKTEMKLGHPEISINIITPEPAPEPTPVVQSELMKNFEEFRLSPSPEHFKTFIEKIKSDDIEELGSLTFEKMRGIINIGFVSPLIQCEISHEIKNLLARKLLEVIEKSKKWKDDKLDKYNKLKAMAE